MLQKIELNSATNYSELIKFLRMQKGVSQSELADKSNITQPQISRYEQGKAIPSIQSLVIICGCLGFRVEIIP